MKKDTAIASPLVCRCRLIPAPRADLEYRCFAEVELANVSEEPIRIISDKPPECLFRFVIRNPDGEVIADDNLSAEVYSFRGVPYRIEITQQEPWCFDTQLFLHVPLDRRVAGEYSVQVFLEYERWSVVSNTLFFTVKLPT